MSARVSLPRFITLLKNSSTAFELGAVFEDDWESGAQMFQFVIRTYGVAVESFTLVSFYQPKHFFYFTALHQFVCSFARTQWIDSLRVQRERYLFSCYTHRSIDFFASLKWPVGSLFCWVVLFLSKPHIPFFPNTLNVFSGKGRLWHATFSYSLNALKAEERQIICHAIEKTGWHARFYSRQIYFSCSALNFPLRLFRGVSATAAWIPGRQNDQWGVKSLPH